MRTTTSKSKNKASKPTTSTMGDDSEICPDDDSSCYHSSAFSESGGGNKSKAGDHEEPLTQNETKAVNRTKMLVYLALFLAAVGIGTLTYMLVSSDESATFESGFAALSVEIEHSIETNANAMFGQMHTLSTTVTSYALTANLTWPNVTFHHFDIRAKELEALTGVEMILFAPLVKVEAKAGWEAYATANQGWIQEDLKYREEGDLDSNTTVPPISAQVYAYSEELFPSDSADEGESEEEEEEEDEDEEAHEDEDEHRALLFEEEDHEDEEEDSEDVGHDPVEHNKNDVLVPLWQRGPTFENDAVKIVNLDLMTLSLFRPAIQSVIDSKQEHLSGVIDYDFLFFTVETGEPESYLLEPVFDDFLEDSNVVAVLIGELAWSNFFTSLLPPDGTAGILVEVEGTDGSHFSYLIHGRKSEYIGTGSYSDPKYDHLKKTHNFGAFHKGSTKFVFVIYPTSALEQTYHTYNPVIYTAVVVLVFFFTALAFVLYDYQVFNRQSKLLTTAQQTNAFMASLFPKDVRRRILEAEAEAQIDSNKGKRGLKPSNKHLLKDFLHDDADISPCVDRPTDEIFETKPIADLFPSATCLFADLVGFTAWSSTREPGHVFMLLETIYHSFDEIAKARRVFKVETIGDCYVAVCGLPEARKDHAVVMARFAKEIRTALHSVLKKLEVKLGPDTAELGIRVGIHSGPITAGVLRGERARFQLFGDTVNTTARIETTGAKDKIHVSSDTAELLEQSGKGHWVTLREEKVHAKGKGELTTYWLNLGTDKLSSSQMSSTSASSSSLPEPSPLDYSTEGHAPNNNGSTLTGKDMRLVSWITDILSRQLREIVARREASDDKPDTLLSLLTLEEAIRRNDHIVINEVKDVIMLPKFDARVAKNQKHERTVDLGDAVKDQLFYYVRTVATMYQQNYFHNFEHASHVTMSVVKLLNRIVAPDVKSRNEATVEKDLHDHTYGITSDPLTQFAVILSAVIHDADHSGVPNMQLVKEAAPICAVYQNKSVAEQNSVDICWGLLMQDSFRDLRHTIYKTTDELKRFRQLMVNTVLATDIMDKELSAARKARWNLAFADSACVEKPVAAEVDVNRKATIVIEHLIQASDIAHTMQHWQVYRKWNERFYLECYEAFKQGRAEKDPSLDWYAGEIGFFDFYIIPLARKLKDCGVFGVSSDEYLNYALQNRKEWELKGKEIVAELVEMKGKEIVAETVETQQTVMGKKSQDHLVEV